MISVYSSDKELSPSGYYRILQYFQHRNDVVVHSGIPSKLRKYSIKSKGLKKKIIDLFIYPICYFRIMGAFIYDLIHLHNDYIIIPQRIIPYKMFFPLNVLYNKLTQKNTLYWDIDDNIFYGNRISKTEAKISMQNSKKIIVTSQYLANLIDKKYQHKIIFMPTTDGDMFCSDISKIITERLKEYQKHVILIWLGTRVNLQFVEPIIPSLDKAAEILKNKYNKELELRIVSNNKILTKTDNLIITNIEWSREVAKQECYKAHIGIMPLVENEFTKGKAGFKLVQYISVALPVIGSAVGYNKEVITEDFGVCLDDKTTLTKWCDAVIYLSTLTDKNYETMSNNAMKRYEDKFSFNKNKQIWMSLCKEDKAISSKT